MQFRSICKSVLVFISLIALAGCSTNAATGKQQFTALMSPKQEVSVGAQEHQKIAKQYGFYENATVNSYVSSIGARISKNTERPDVKYKFYVLDSPIVNAFALPGGYVYVSRGLLGLANSEAELAAVLGHEVGHITGRHSAERYSRGTLASLGAAAVSIATRSNAASQAASLGANLYLSSYSRGQENESDSLGMRYMTRGGYDVDQMPSFLKSMYENAQLQKRLDGKKTGAGANYFSTHPPTQNRVSATRTASAGYPDGGAVGRDTYLKAINGMNYGDSADQGFIRGQSFIHTGIGFSFDAPSGFKLVNQPTQVIAKDKNSSAVMIFDMGGVKATVDPETYLSQLWMKDKPLKGLERSKVNGMNAATASFAGNVNGKPMTIRLVAIQFAPKKFARFQIAIPNGASSALVNALKTASYSFRKPNGTDRAKAKPQKIKIVTARAGDTITSMGGRMAVDELPIERFRVLNGLSAGQALVRGRQYKLIVQ